MMITMPFIYGFCVDEVNATLVRIFLKYFNDCHLECLETTEEIGNRILPTKPINLHNIVVIN